MSAPPPPPPPAPPPPPPSSGLPPAFSQGRTTKPKQNDPSARSALLSDIHKGARLKKVTQINDRSAPAIDSGKKNGSSGNGRGAVVPPSGGLFAGGFPVLKSSGQRDISGTKNALQLPGQRTGSPKNQDQMPSMTKPAGSSFTPPDPPRPLPATVAYRPAPPRPNILGSSFPPPPPTPPSGSKPQLVVQPGPALPPFKERSAKPFNPPPLPPSHPQGDKPSRFQGSPSNSFHPPPPPPLPSSGFHGRTSEFSSSPTPPPDARDYSAPLPPPPPPPLSSGSTVELYETFSPPFNPNFPLPPPIPPPIPYSARRRLSEPFPPPPSFLAEHSNTPPPRPTKAPQFANAKQLVPPLPPHGRIQKGAVPGGGRLAPPPIPPARAPTTELSNRQPSNQHSSGRNASPQRYPLPKSGGMQLIDDFESKFTFHPVEELPPPDRFEPYERIYPSKMSSIRQELPPPPPVRFQMR
ncbi:WAS/WASL-interacting protein family member 3 [Discoglossus pictus]